MRRTRNVHTKSRFMFALMVRVNRLARRKPGLRRRGSETRALLLDAWATCLTHTLRNGHWERLGPRTTPKPAGE